MGGGRWEPEEWKSYTATKSYDTKTTAEIFTKSEIDENLDPKNIKMRESRDSDHNPASNAIVLALDVTGSMGKISDYIAREGLNVLLTEIYNRKPVADPHVLCMGIGDVECDRAPVQATQFEADIKIMEQVEKIYLEGGGGGNGYESYAAAWYFAATKTSIDCFEKRGKKGYLFTIGDEPPTPQIYKRHIEKFFGDSIQREQLSGEELLHMAQRQYEVFHVIVDEGNHARYHPKEVHSEWTDLLGQNVLHMSDYKKLAEVIVSVIQVREGADKKTIVDSWDGSTSVVIKNAINSLSARNSSGDKNGLVTL
jgi:hypothetical protein